MNQELFSYEKANECQYDKDGKINIDNATEYIKKFFIPMTNGNHIFTQENTYKIFDKTTIKDVYFNRFHPNISKWYFNKHTDVKTPVCEINKPFLYDRNVNLAKPFKHNKKPYESFPLETKKKVEKLLKLMKEVWANNDKEVFTYIVNWFSNMAKGNKNQSILYLKGVQGIGKSTITEFMTNNVIGEPAFVTGSEPLKSHFNISLMGKLLVVFEELENFNSNEWQVISSRLKRECTSYNSVYEAKGKDPITAKNNNNFIVLSNNDAVKDDDGRRYVILDLSLKYKDQFDFWTEFYEECVNDKVGEAFYNYLLEIDTSKFKSMVFPQTESKKDAIVKRLDTVAMFLKDKYVLNKIGISTTVTNLHVAYISYCSTKNNKHCGKIEFNKRMEEYGIKYFKSSSVNKYKISEEELLKIANKNKWIHKLDDFKPDIDENEEALEYGIEKKDMSVNVNMFLKKENEELKQKIKDLEKQLKNKVPQKDPKKIKKDIHELLSKHGLFERDKRIQENLDDITSKQAKLQLKNQSEDENINNTFFKF